MSPLLGYHYIYNTKTVIIQGGSIEFSFPLLHSFEVEGVNVLLAHPVWLYVIVIGFFSVHTHAHICLREKGSNNSIGRRLTSYIIIHHPEYVWRIDCTLWFYWEINDQINLLKYDSRRASFLIMWFSDSFEIELSKNVLTLELFWDHFNPFWWHHTFYLYIQNDYSLYDSPLVKLNNMHTMYMRRKT